MTTWHIISPKFPPLRGGIGFHTAHLGGGLVSKGNTVHVWTTSTSDDEKHQNIVKKIDDVVFASKHTMNTKSSSQKKLSVHRIITQFTDESLYQIEQQISEIGGTLLLQYRPESFGSFWSYAIANLYEKLSKKVDCRVLIHEPFAVPDFRFFNFKTWFAAFHQYFILRKILKSSTHAYVTTSNWRRFLRPFKITYPVLTLPVPSNLEEVAEPQRSKNLRKAFAPNAKLIFGTYSSFKEPETLVILEEVVVKLLKDHPQWVWLALGRYSEEFALELKDRYPEISNQIQNGGELSNLALSAHLQACDLIFQPYFHGVNTRRTSLMAALYHAMPTVTSHGHRTEDIWREMRCVKLVQWDNIGDYIHEIEKLAKNSTQRSELSQAARLAYETCFSLDHNVRLLTSE